MANAEHRIALARQALATLDELADTPANRIVRDAAIQRFECSFEATWKAAQAVLHKRYGLELASLKPATRASFENGLLSEEDARLGLAMVDHRNLTAHAYNERWPMRSLRRSPLTASCCMPGSTACNNSRRS